VGGDGVPLTSYELAAGQTNVRMDISVSDVCLSGSKDTKHDNSRSERYSELNEAPLWLVFI